MLLRTKQLLGKKTSKSFNVPFSSQQRLSDTMKQSVQ